MKRREGKSTGGAAHGRITFELGDIGFGYRPRAPYACDPAQSRGRFYDESESPTRTPFQRDRDRIIHSTAFRRLKHKTQVFVAHEGDHYRTRLTHTIEVAQIARALARALRCDEDLAEAVALVHDFGHTPFGHTGEDALNEKMAGWGGFDHNAQSLRVVTRLERRYAEFDGLNSDLGDAGRAGQAQWPADRTACGRGAEGAGAASHPRLIELYRPRARPLRQPRSAMRGDCRRHRLQHP